MVVALQALAHHLDHGNAAGHRALEIQRHAILLGKRGERRPVMGEQRLVGGDHMLAGAERSLDRLLGDPAPRRRSARRTRRSSGSCASATGSCTKRKPEISTSRFLRRSERRDGDDLDRPSMRVRQARARAPRGAARARLRRCRHRPVRASSPSRHGKDQNVLFAFEAMGMTLCRVLADLARNFRMLRAAWRMRCSFSTSAMRT